MIGSWNPKIKLRISFWVLDRFFDEVSYPCWCGTFFCEKLRNLLFGKKKSGILKLFNNESRRGLEHPIHLVFRNKKQNKTSVLFGFFSFKIFKINVLGIMKNEIVKLYFANSPFTIHHSPFTIHHYSVFIRNFNILFQSCRHWRRIFIR